MPIKNVEMKVLKNKKSLFFLMFSCSHGLTQPQVSRSKSVHCTSRTDGQIDTYESEYRGHSFRVSGFFSYNLSSRIGPRMSRTSSVLSLSINEGIILRAKMSD